MELFYNNKVEWIKADVENSYDCDLEKPSLEILAEFFNCEVISLKFAGPEEFAEGLDLKIEDEGQMLDACVEYIVLFNDFKEKLFESEEVENDIYDRLEYETVNAFELEDKIYVYVTEKGYESIITS